LPICCCSTPTKSGFRRRRVNDLPGGGPRTIRDPLGVHGVFVNGVEVFDGRDYRPLGRGPGQVLDRFLPTGALSQQRLGEERRSGMGLSSQEANRIVEGAVAKARELNIRISAAVFDAGGRLIAFQRMDNAIFASVYGSQGKAIASAAFDRPSGEMAERSADAARRRAGGRRPHDHGPGGRADHPQRRRRGRLRRRRRHRAAGRRLRPGWRGPAIHTPNLRLK
jgi:uncharacterized protein GlcG (DUF336 family)